MRLRIATLAVIVVAAVIVFALRPRGSRQTLRDGSRLTLSSVKVGRTNTFTHGTLLSKTIGRLVPTNGLSVAGLSLQRPTKLTFPADDGGIMMVAELRLEPSSATNHLVATFREPWRHRVLISGDDGFAHRQSVREFQRYPEGFCAYIFAHSFPRRSSSLHFRLEERDSFRDDWRLVTTFEARNPMGSPPERWTAQKTAALILANGVKVEIGEITVGLSTNANLSEHVATVPARFSHDSVILTNWVIAGSRMTDATGNYGRLGGRIKWTPISDGWRMHRGKPLDPTVPWRLHLNFAQDANFPETNLFSFFVTWPLSTTIHTNLGGRAIRIGFVNTDMLDVKLMSEDEDVRLTFVSATDDSGADLEDSSGSWGQHSFWRSLKLRSAVQPVRVNANVAIHSNFTNEVILQPRLQ